MAFAPGVGLAVAGLWLRYPGRGLSPSTADEYLHGVPRASRVSACGTCFTAWSRRSRRSAAAARSGLEGPSIYMGATIGSALQRRWRSLLVGADPNLLLVAGAAAGIAAIFKAPATGAIFAIEVPFQEELARRMLLPALVAGGERLPRAGRDQRNDAAVPGSRRAAVLVRRSRGRGGARVGCRLRRAARSRRSCAAPSTWRRSRPSGRARGRVRRDHRRALRDRARPHRASRSCSRPATA